MFSPTPDPDIYSDAHFEKLEREYLRAKAKKDDNELYKIVSRLRYRIQRALRNSSEDNSQFQNLGNFTNYTPKPILAISSFEPSELTKKYWELDADLEKDELRLAEKFKKQDFKYSGDIEKLKALFEKIKQFFRPHTKENNFIHIFSAIPQYEEWEPLQWDESNRLLAYFLNAMCNRPNALISKEWQSIAGNGSFFLNKRGKALKTLDLAKAISDVRIISPQPKNFEIIDNALKPFQKK